MKHKIFIAILGLLVLVSSVIATDFMTFSGTIGNNPEPIFEEDDSNNSGGSSSSSGGSSSNRRSSSRKSSKKKIWEEIVYVSGFEEDEKPLGKGEETNVFKNKKEAPITAPSSIASILIGVLIMLTIIIIGLGMYMVGKKK